MNKEEKNLLKNAETIILVTDNGCEIKGFTPDVLTLYCELTRELKNVKGCNEEWIRANVDMAFMNEEELEKKGKELEKETLNEFEKMIKKIMGVNDDVERGRKTTKRK